MNGSFDPIEAVLAETVDEEFYAFSYGDLPSGVAPPTHYAREGWLLGHDPNPWFSTQAYLEAHPDVAAAGLNPLAHYLQTGASEGRLILASRLAAAYYERPPAIASPQGASASVRSDDERFYRRRVVGEEFDEQYYLTLHPDVARAGVDPLEHFLESGWREGRDPNPYFSVRQYLEANVDVADAGVNPFYHYLTTGKLEGRSLRLEVGFRFDIIAEQESLEDRMNSIPGPAPSDVSDAAALRSALAPLWNVPKRGLHLTVSHDDYTANVGGVQFCLARESAAFERLGIDRLHIFPGRPLLITANADRDPTVGVLVNGILAGLFAASTVAEELERGFEHGIGTERTFAIHSCLGHNVDAIAAILRALAMRAGFFWIHDFASVCAGYSLLRNNVEFCHAPSSESAACKICTYGARRDVQVADHERLFEEFELTSVAPSHSAMTIWKAATRLPAHDTIVHPHCTLLPMQTAPSQPGAPLRVAFLGYPNAHKGWPVFRELVRRFGRDERIEFHHLGMFPVPNRAISFTEVNGSTISSNAMIEAVASRRIDVALIWSIWPETFCFTAYEAVAGGAAIIAPPDSGNVAALIRETGAGLVVSDELALYEFFGSDRIDHLKRENRSTRRYSLQYSSMTADLVGAVV